MTKEELQIELDKVDRELWQVLDVLYYGNEKIDNLFVIKKIKCGDDTVYESSENNRIYTKCDNALDVFDEKANLIKRIFKKLTEIEYFTQEKKQILVIGKDGKKYQHTIENECHCVEKDGAKHVFGESGRRLGVYMKIPGRSGEIE